MICLAPGKSDKGVSFLFAHRSLPSHPASNRKRGQVHVTRRRIGLEAGTSVRQDIPGGQLSKRNCAYFAISTFSFILGH